MESSERHNTLVHFRFNPEYKAQRGRHGEGSNCTGRDGEDILLKVPVGTLSMTRRPANWCTTSSDPMRRIVSLSGGRGGRGNQHFATSTHQAPREHELGRPGEEQHLRLELKLLADVGLVGYPNVGKSTLISRISAARPKIADYPFTTLEPNLGVVSIGEAPHEESFVVADIPGLIEGAHRAQGWVCSSCGTSSAHGCWCTWWMFRMRAVVPIRWKTFKVIVGELESFGQGSMRSR